MLCVMRYANVNLTCFHAGTLQFYRPLPFFNLWRLLSGNEKRMLATCSTSCGRPKQGGSLHLFRTPTARSEPTQLRQ